MQKRGYQSLLLCIRRAADSAGEALDTRSTANPMIDWISLRSFGHAQKRGLKMTRSLLIVFCALVLAAVGYSLAFTIHGPSIRAAVSTVAGGTAGIAMAWASINVRERWLHQGRRTA